MNRSIKFRIYSFLDKTFHHFTLEEAYPQGIAGGVSEPQQYTGLNDKDNNPIFEGDLVELHTAANDHAKNIKENHYGLYEIYWDRCYKLKTIKPNWFFIPNFESPAADYNIMKVIGNIFEHKHLLEK
jgi:uncharacterized phage protein (TIGR01671 family)